MPLNVQPLSRTRQAVMVVVMLVLLLASLGLAHYLVLRRQNNVSVKALFPPPDGLTRLPVNDTFQDALKGTLVDGRVRWQEGPRRFMAFCFADEVGDSDLVYLGILFSRVSGLDETQPLSYKPAILAGYRAFEAEKQLGKAPNSTFVILRLAKVEGYIVAFSFSGEGRLTDEERASFEQYCTHQIKITVAKNNSQKG